MTTALLEQQFRGPGAAARAGLVAIRGEPGQVIFPGRAGRNNELTPLAPHFSGQCGPEQ
jgi:hypothetical protein